MDNTQIFHIEYTGLDIDGFNVGKKTFILTIDNGPNEVNASVVEIAKNKIDDQECIFRSWISSIRYLGRAFSA